jgi:hypothetical protein
VVSCFQKGVKCLDVGCKRTAAVMFRAALALYTKDRGTPEAKAVLRRLKDALGHMQTALGDLSSVRERSNSPGLHAAVWDSLVKPRQPGALPWLELLFG